MKRTTPVTHVNGAHEVPPGLKDLPRHVAIIMDGNGRWAVQRHLPRHAGHRAGTRNIRKIVEEFALRGIPYLTLYAFSTENWSRPSREVEALLSILEQVIDEQAQALHHEGVRLLHLGRLDRLSPSLQKAIKRALDLTKDNTRLTLSV
ncbi:MAG: di-trans,poly-cis-decaprenylcistransferase, partial [Dehalococcoidia bacterium]|nr:di-trans,poly-cis-decaprenylcistransferase [Dehalococcoidia bacterium]